MLGREVWNSVGMATDDVGEFLVRGAAEVLG